MYSERPVKKYLVNNNYVQGIHIKFKAGQCFGGVLSLADINNTFPSKYQHVGSNKLKLLFQMTQDS